MNLKIFALLLILILPHFALGQSNTGTIKGRVLNSKTNEPVPFASVVVWGTTIGAMTDFDGNFSFTGLKPGFTELRASSIGFNPYISEAIMVTNSAVVNLDILLEESEIAIQEVVIKASPFRKIID